MSKGRLLAIGAHTDDIELGAGGLISSALVGGWEVHYLIFSIARDSVPKGCEPEILRSEATRAAERMGVQPNNLTILDVPVRQFPSRRQEILDQLIMTRRTGFDAVVCHSVHDVHQDHQTVALECARAFKSVRWLLAYNLPWNAVDVRGPQPDFFVKLSRDDVLRKVDALSAFETQRVLGRPYFTEEFLVSWARFTGVQANSEFAEAFSLVRAIVKVS